MGDEGNRDNRRFRVMDSVSTNGARSSGPSRISADVQEATSVQPPALPARSTHNFPSSSQHRNRSSSEVRYRGNSSLNGPRSLFLRRAENGFGFTLRHFIVYPPESYTLLAGDRRLGLRNGPIDEPMDTIFVKHVRDGSPASIAGLTTGDRILSVNGENIAGLTYARVIQLIHRSGNYLHLLVVPKENDILQLYFGDTAHNPETNPRPRLRSPDPPTMNNRESRRSEMMRYGTTRHDTNPIYQNLNEVKKDRSTSHRNSRRSSEGNNERRNEAAVLTTKVKETSQALSNPSNGTTNNNNNDTLIVNNNTPACRLSLDAALSKCRDSIESGNAFDSLSDSSSTIKESLSSDDSVILSRIRKSFEQKEEFLKRPAHVPSSELTETKMAAKEFYSQPPKIINPLWPPSQPISSSSNYKHDCPQNHDRNMTRNKQNFVKTLDNIEENSQSKESIENCSPASQMVAMRAKQFESPQKEDKIDLYRSELARLSSKQNVINIANRKREFESFAKAGRKSFAVRESRSLDSPVVPYQAMGSVIGSGNRTIPIGSKNLHCTPPEDFSQFVDENDCWSKSKPVMRQDSYLAACSKPTICKNHHTSTTHILDNGGGSSDTYNSTELLKAQQRQKNNDHVAIRPTLLRLDRSAKVKNGEFIFSNGNFIRVTKKEDEKESKNDAKSSDLLNDSEDDKCTRRISYLKATWGDRMNTDSEYEMSDSEANSNAIPERSVLGTRRITCEDIEETGKDSNQQVVSKEGNVLCKVTQIDGKKATDRSWKPVWMVLKGPILSLYKERRNSINTHPETPGTFDRSDLGASCDQIDIRSSLVEVASDYTKRKNVLRLNAPSVGAQLLLQAEDGHSMTQWVKLLQNQSTVGSSNTLEALDTSLNTLPNTSNKALRKLTALRNRSPTGDSPIVKNKKSAQDQAQISPKSMTWRNRMAKQLKRIQQGSMGTTTQSSTSYTPGATIGIPLEACPTSSFSEYVPLLVEICTSLVEAKGLEIIGIYRVPGNTAAVMSLTEAVNRGLDAGILDQDPRWSDVNVISSLLKSFFRRLPDCLLTSELYPHFIKADKCEDPIRRMVTIRKLIQDLPDHNLETLKYLLLHLKKVVANASVNKMEARNLAIVFGPTLVRTSDNNMVTMVTDMSHQCRIVESLILHADWCFGDGSIDDLKSSISDVAPQPGLEPSTQHQNLLLGNARKVESMQSPLSAKDIMSSIIGAANKKMHKATSKQRRKGGATSGNNAVQITSSSEDIIDSSDAKEAGINESSEVGKDDEHNLEIECTDNNRPEWIEEKQIIENTQLEDIKEKDEEKEEMKCESKDLENGNTWTYAGLSATTQERIRRFEQETKAMLQREQNRQRHTATLPLDDVDFKFENSMKKMEEERKEKEVKDAIETYKPPPVLVVRRNSTRDTADNNSLNSQDKMNNLKRLKTGKEFTTQTNSLNSPNQTNERPSSHVSDDGNDLLSSLTSTFDMKLKSILTTDEKNGNVINGNNGNNESEDSTALLKDGKKEGKVIVNGTLFRDPSLHRCLERRRKPADVQQDDSYDSSSSENIKITGGSGGNNNVETTNGICMNCKQGGVIDEKDERRDDYDLATTGAGKMSGKREVKLFHSNSVRLRRTVSLNKHQYPEQSIIKLRRSGSLNKSERFEAKISKFESLILIKNADAIKLKRIDSSSLTKNEKTECNLIKKRQQELKYKQRSSTGCDKEGGGKLKRRSYGKDRSIKRRHTVGGTKDFDKITWLEKNKQKENIVHNEQINHRRQRRTSSPDLSGGRIAAADVLVEVVVRPRSFITADPNFVSRLFNIPLESHV